MKNYLALLIFLLPFFIHSQEQQTLEKKYVDMYVSNVPIPKIIKKLNKEKKKIDINQVMEIIDSLIYKSRKIKDVEGLYQLLMGKVDLGGRDILILEDTIGTYLRENYPDYYKQLEHYLNQKFIEYCNKYYPKIDIELTLVYRYLERYDQRYKLMMMMPKYQSNKNTLDSLRIMSDNQDSVTEKMLGNIFENNGIPGIDDVGPEVNSVIIFLLHLSPDFVFKYLPELQRKIKNKEIFISEEGFEFLVDKKLHQCCHKTIYGTGWSKYSPLVKDPKEVERIKEKIGIE